MFRHLASILLLTFAFTGTMAQDALQTIVTRGPVEAGESFQVQYVLEDTDSDSEFFAPDFKGFRFVSGPNIYSGSALSASGPKKLKNIVFTLAAMKPGRFIVPGASARVGNSLIKSRSVLLEVVSAAAAHVKTRQSFTGEINEDRFLGPGEDPYAKIKHNLFMRVQVDKKSCYVGEPVTATFKLYSRLDSRSDIVKNPGFYGFTVQDMINLDNRLTSIETINGKKFDVHTIRKVQLYPLQAGTFSIDAMEVHNKIRFSKSAVGRKAEQEVVEGIFPDNEISDEKITAEYESDMATVSLPIHVKPTPPQNKPLDYTGATGQFTLKAIIQRSEVARNEEGELVVTIGGQGNFSQLSAPIIKWPAGIEGFEPAVKDFLDHTQSPMNGKREFHYRFVSARPGTYVLPSINFSFFNPDSNKYKLVSSGEMNIVVGNKEKAASIQVTQAREKANHSSDRAWWLTGAIALALAALLFLFTRKKRKGDRPKPAVAELSGADFIAEVLEPAQKFCEIDNRTFYDALRNCIWRYFTKFLGLAGSNMNKRILNAELLNKKVDEQSRNEILDILDRCETGIFTSAEPQGNQKKLLEDTKNTLLKISQQMQG